MVVSHHANSLKSVLLVGLLLFMTFLTGCGDPEPIKIGVVGGFSGRRSEIGVVARNAIQLLVDEVNAEGGIKGRQIELDIRDTKGDPERCLIILNAMTAENVHFFLGPFLSQMAESTVKSMEGKDALVVTPTMSTDYLSDRDDNIVRTSSTTSQQARHLAEYMADKGFKQVAVIYDLSNKKYTELLYKSFAEDAQELNMTVTTTMTIPKTRHPEMLPIARQLIASGADSVLMCLAAIDAANLSQQLRKLGSDMHLVGVSWAQTDDLILHGGRAVEGMALVATRNYSAPTEAFISFNQQYKDRYKTTPSFAGGRAYDGMGLLIEGMRLADEITPTKVKKAILTLGTYQGLSSPIHINEYGDSPGAYTMVIVQNGKYVTAP